MYGNCRHCGLKNGGIKRRCKHCGQPLHRVVFVRNDVYELLTTVTADVIRKWDRWQGHYWDRTGVVAEHVACLLDEPPGSTLYRVREYKDGTFGRPQTSPLPRYGAAEALLMAASRVRRVAGL